MVVNFIFSTNQCDGDDNDASVSGSPTLSGGKKRRSQEDMLDSQSSEDAQMEEM